MLRSLRFRLAAFFLFGVVVAGLVAAAISFQLIQSYQLKRARADIRREAAGLTELYAFRATQVVRPNQRNDIPQIPAHTLEDATGDKLYYLPAAALIALFPREVPVLPRISRRTVPLKALQQGKTIQFEFVPPHEHRTFIAVARPLELTKQKLFFGAIVVARPKDQLGTQVGPLLGRLALALLGGLIVATLLGLYLSRRITRPVLQLSNVADQVASGRLDVEVPEVRGAGEIGHLSERLREMTVRLAESELRERNFFMSVSHELRTPLTAIRGHVDALREGLAEDPALRAESLEVIAEEAGRLERLVGEVLDLAKLEGHRFALSREEVDMERLCDRAYATFSEEARRRAIDYRHAASAKPVIVADGDRVLQIITNLLSNAFRWTPDGGRIALDLHADNGAVGVSVEDSGPGIPPYDQERIFRAFWSRDGSGTGLGLAIARELAEAHGGRIELVSEPGHGSRFELVLPAEPV
ncbi:MAG TPA: HAMP domain-containing sensor histidine kinase [Gaiellaceae bacterium]